MAKTISRIISVKSSEAKPSGKTFGNPPPGDKTSGLESAISLYALEDGGNTEEGEESEIPIIHNSSLVESKQNLVKRKFPYIDTFDHEGPTVVSAMWDLTSG